MYDLFKVSIEDVRTGKQAYFYINGIEGLLGSDCFQEVFVIKDGEKFGMRVGDFIKDKLGYGASDKEALPGEV